MEHFERIVRVRGKCIRPKTRASTLHGRKKRPDGLAAESEAFHVMLLERDGFEVMRSRISLDFGMFKFLSLHIFAFEPAQPLGSCCIRNGCTFKVLPPLIDQPHSRLLPKPCAEPESVLPMLHAGSFVRRPRKY